MHIYLWMYVCCSETLFEWNNRMCTRGHFQSMQENTMIEATFIDTWSYLLNENELLRDDSSPLRLFMISETTVCALYSIYSISNLIYFGSK